MDSIKQCPIDRPLKHHRWRALGGLVLCVTLISAPALLAIDCHELELVTESLLDNHYVHRNYDNALSQRILDQLLIEIDPGKLVFYQSDVDELKEAFGNEIDLSLIHI